MRILTIGNLFFWFRITLQALLKGYGVTFPEHILGLLTEHMVMPGDKSCSSIVTSEVPRPSAPRFRPQMDISVRISQSLTLKSLVQLREGIGDFLDPISDYIEMMVFMKLRRSLLFETCLMHYLKEVCPQSSSPELTVRDAFSPVTSLPGITREPNRKQMHNLNRSLARTENSLLELVSGKVQYGALTLDGELDLTDIDLEHEFKILLELVPLLKQRFPDTAVSDDAGLEKVKDLLELLKLMEKITIMQEVFCQYQMRCCREGDGFVTIMRIKEELRTETKRAQLTPSVASETLHCVKDILLFTSEQHYKCLDLFSAIAESGAFYDFLKDNQFTGEKGKEKFESTYLLITTQLQHEEYDQCVLNHLGGAFRIIQPFTQHNISLEELMKQILKFPVKSVITQLTTVRSNITLIQIWFLRAEVRALLQ